MGEKKAVWEVVQRLLELKASNWPFWVRYHLAVRKIWTVTTAIMMNVPDAALNLVGALALFLAYLPSLVIWISVMLHELFSHDEKTDFEQLARLLTEFRRKVAELKQDDDETEG